MLPGSTSLQNSISARMVSLHLECGLDTADIAGIASLTRLQELKVHILNKCVVSQDHLQALGNLPALQSLAVSFNWPNTEQQGYTSLSAFQHSPVVDLSIVPSRDILQDSGSLPNLRTLCLDSSGVWPRAAVSIPSKLSALSMLQQLDLDRVVLSGNLWGLLTLG